jgi:hypothetical protein
LYTHLHMASTGFIRVIENVSMFFRGGVRRNLFFFIGGCLVLAWPFYYVGLYTSKAVRYTWLDESIVINKPIFSTTADLIIGKSEVVDLIDGQKDLYLTIDNKNNPTIGYYPYIYELQVLDDQGSVITTEKGKSYILPGDIKYITARDTTGNAASIKLIQQAGTQAVEYNVQKNPFQILPKVDTVNQRIEPLNDETLKITSQFINRDKLSITEVDVLYILRDRREKIIGIGTTKFNGFVPESTRDFTANHPKHINAEATNLDVRWSTNFLADGNVKFK